jgi:hypothetical protein
VVAGLFNQRDPLSPALPLCSGSKTYERLLDPALVKAAGFFFVITSQPLGSCRRQSLPIKQCSQWSRLAVQVRFTSSGQGSSHD